jgi:hypothetical protein
VGPINASANNITTTGNVSANRVIVGTSGITGIGPINIGSNSITTTGSVSAGSVSATTFSASSDYRIKTDVTPLNLEEYSVNNLKPVFFKFKDSGKESIGLIAHELQEYYSFLVEGEKDGEKTQSVNYIGLIGVLIKEIQELKNRVKILENKILENKI